MKPAAIDISGLCKSFGTGKKRQTVVNSLSLRVCQGEVFGFLGPNGAGKSTTIKLLLGFIKPDRGNMQILDLRVGRDEYRNHIGYLPEFPLFYDHLTAEETLLLSGRLCGMNKSTIVERTAFLLERMNLHHAASRRVSGFSKGMKQRLGMANALIHDPQVLIFDEPMSGLDPVGRHQVKKLIGELKAEGKTIFFSSHILNDIEILCDNIGLIHQGELLFCGALKDFTADGDRGLEERFIEAIAEVENESCS